MLRTICSVLVPVGFLGAAWVYALNAAPDVSLVLCKPESFKHCRCFEDPGLVDVTVCCTCTQPDLGITQFCLGDEGLK